MSDFFVDDKDIYEYLSQPVLLEFLNRNGFPATTKTLAKYSKLGLLMLPKSKVFRHTNKNSRTYYSPLSVIEFMTAYLLSSGDYKKVKSQKRIAHFTTQEIFAGRIAFFYGSPSFLDGRSYVIEDGLFNYHSYEFVFPEQSLELHKQAVIKVRMKNLDFRYMNMVSSLLNEFYQSEELGNATIGYVELLYRNTFQALYDQYIEEILNLR